MRSVLAPFYPLFFVHGAGSICSKIYKTGRRRPDGGSRPVPGSPEIVRTLTKWRGEKRPWRYRKRPFWPTGRAKRFSTYRPTAICHGGKRAVRVSVCSARTCVSNRAAEVVRALTTWRPKAAGCEPQARRSRLAACSLWAVTSGRLGLSLAACNPRYPLLRRRALGTGTG
jgi:hypothetical protein